MSATARRYLTLLGRASHYEIQARYFPAASDTAENLRRAACEIRRRAARIYPLTIH